MFYVNEELHEHELTELAGIIIKDLKYSRHLGEREKNTEDLLYYALFLLVAMATARLEDFVTHRIQNRGSLFLSQQVREIELKQASEVKTCWGLWGPEMRHLTLRTIVYQFWKG